MNKNFNLKSIKKIHFIGIGGAGMYPLAQILNKEGYEIAGSDNYISDTLNEALSKNFKIYLDHKPENVNADLVVYSAAIKEDNPELNYAKNNNIKILKRSELLGILMNRYKKLIAISGTHGKTTTSAMLTHLLTFAKLDPTAVIGGKLKELNGNSRLGNSEFAVCEACEYVDTFLELDPFVSVILNIEEDHLDYFKNLENLTNSFRKFANNASGLIVLNAKDENSLNAVKNAKVPIVGFCLNEDINESKINFLYKYTAKNINENKGYCEFTVLKNNTEFLNIKLNIPGKHNIYNALAAVSVADYFKIDPSKIKEGIESFNGVHRRLEKLYKINNITIMDDFAHHPTEIKASLSAVKKMGFSRVITIFQPHTYSRTKSFLKEFASAFALSDLVIVSEILAVREKNIYNICSEDLVKLMKNGIYLKTFNEIEDYALKIAKPGDLILTMGGGNVYKCANSLVEKMKAKYN